MREHSRSEERTGCQESRDYGEKYDVQSDFVMVYGLHSLKERISHWKQRGYVIHLMTGIAWGGYQDYLYGKFDGRDHHDEGQTNRAGEEINHGKYVPYMVPSVSFSRYLAEKLKIAIDCGVEAIHLEEPEFWVEAGYSEAFKREWQIYYKEAWLDPQATCEGQYKASKLKQYLYKRTLDRLCSELKEYSLIKYGRVIRFYVATHSLINYSQWKIVSPESALLDLPSIDGYIAQIWTGTSRVMNTYRGIRRERTFENAFLEYGVMQELVSGTDRKMWFLHDPIEDNPNHTWDDYRENYYRTVAASLFHPKISDYEFITWPSRVFTGKYPSGSFSEKTEIPAEYKTNLLTVMHILGDMKTDDTEWLTNTGKIGVILSDTCLFQRMYPQGDPRREDCLTVLWDPFFGLAMPLLKSGLCVRPVQLENISRFPGYLNGYKKLVLSYEFMKPESPDVHNAIAQWVKNGGNLIYAGNGADSFHGIPHWWNSREADYNNPAEHLFEALGLTRDPEEGVYIIGKGSLTYMREAPGNIAKEPSLCDKYLSVVSDMFDRAGESLTPSSHLALRRGRYVVAASLDESGSESALSLEGVFINLFDSRLSVRENPKLNSGEVGLFLDLSRIDRNASSDILAVSGRVADINQTRRSLTFTVTAPGEMRGCARVWTKRPPKTATVKTGGAETEVNATYDEATGTTYIDFPSSADGELIKIVF